MTRPCYVKPNEVEADVAKFLAQGGKVTPVPAGVSGLAPKNPALKILTVAQRAAINAVR